MRKEHGKDRVLEICTGDFGTGGCGVIVWNLYNNMNIKSKIDFYCYQRPESRFISEIEKNGGKCWYRKSHKNLIVQKFSEYRDIRKIVNEGQYDCAHIHLSNAQIQYLSFLASKRYVNIVLCHSHCTDLSGTAAAGETIRRTAHDFCKKRLHSEMIVPLACSDDAAKWLFPPSVIENKQYTVIKNGINAEKFMFNAGVRDSVRKKLGLENNFVVGHVGRFVYQKNHEFLIEAFAGVKKVCPSAVLLLIGGEAGENLGGEIRGKVSSLGLENDVIFYGNTDRVNELYQAMDCFVFPSRYEGLGIVAIEAQAAGLKTLCSDEVPQEAKITELLEYMPLSDGAEKWAEKILTYNDGYERKNMSNEITASGYDIKASAKQLENIYLHCCQEDMEKR